MSKRLIRQRLLNKVEHNNMPRCPKCGKSLMEASNKAYRCPLHGRIEAKMLEKSLRQKVTEVLDAASTSS